ncbi:MAG: ferritin-like domain-containing protein [Thermaurantiacus sp.]
MAEGEGARPCRGGAEGRGGAGLTGKTRVTVGDAALHAFLTAEPRAKARSARDLARAWGAERLVPGPASATWPERPARPVRPVLVAPGEMPRRRRAGSPQGRFALLHALAHIECNAIDLALDIVGRFGPAMPPEFTTDWLQVGAEEALHFLMLERLLRRSGGRYGDLPAHDGLWQAAEATAGNLAARLAVVPQVLEARGLDVTPAMIVRFETMGDHQAASVLRRILADEIGHVEAGNRWFRHLARESGEEPATWFRRLVTSHFQGEVKPPFNDSARAHAGLTMDWYSSLGSAVPACKS